MGKQFWSYQIARKIVTLIGSRGRKEIIGKEGS